MTRKSLIHTSCRGQRRSRSALMFLVFLITIALLLTGCASLVMSPTDRMMMDGKYAEVEKQKGGTEKNLSTAKSEDIIDLCYACYKLKKYDKLFAYLDQLEENIHNGDATVFKRTFLQFNRRSGTYYPEDITVLPPLMRAEVLIDFGDYDKAIKNADAALRLNDSVKYSRQDNLLNWPNRLRIRALGVLALAQAIKGDRPAARRTLELLENAKVGFMVRYMILKEKHLMLARVYMALGKYDKVLELKTPAFDSLASFAQNVLMGAKLTGDDLYTFVELPRKFMLTKALQELGRIGEAKAGYDELLGNPSTSSNGDIYWLLLFERGRIAESEGNLQEATELYRKSIDIIESQRATINSEASKIGFVGDKQNVYHHMVSALIATGRQAAAFEYVERAKSRALVDMLASNQDLSAERPEIKSYLSELDAAERETKALAIGQEATAVAQSRTRSIQIRKRIHATAPELYSLIAVSVPPAPEIQALLSPTETILEYYYMENDLYAFAVTPKDIRVVHLDGKALSEEIAALRQAISRPESDACFSLLSRSYHRLLEPVEGYLSTSNLVIVPHGILHYVPFGALYRGKDYLIDRFAVSYLPSSTVLKFLSARKISGRHHLLVLGNPDLGDARLDLKYAEEESLDISKGFPGAQVLLRAEATETAFKKQATDFNYIHFASHALFEPDSPLNSALFLRGDAENDGRLKASELYAMRLKADLITLSACETGVTKICNGDDIVGLTRGFLYAGGNTIVASLWQVDDLATSQLMVEFYSRLEKLGKRNALREAQLIVRKQYPHPYFWAAFQLIGLSQ